MAGTDTEAQTKCQVNIRPSATSPVEKRNWQRFWQKIFAEVKAEAAGDGRGCVEEKTDGK